MAYLRLNQNAPVNRKLKIPGFLGCIMLLLSFPAQTQHNTRDLATIFPQKLIFLGMAIEEPDYFLWGASPVIDENGKVHLFAARWPAEQEMKGWKTHSEIARYTSNSPEGPFEFQEVVISGRPGKMAPHNPNISKIDGKYYLLHICNTEALSKNQEIYMMVAETPEGPWKQVNGNGLVLSPPENKEIWCYDSRVGVNNPSFLKDYQGKYRIYFKAAPQDGGERRFGVAISENPEGPYVHQPQSVTSNTGLVEDAYSFMYNAKYYLLSRTGKDSIIKGVDGLLWESDDGIMFNDPVPGYYGVNHYLPNHNVNHIARSGQFERPQLLINNGTPRYLFTAAPFNTEGRAVTCTYVFRIEYP